MPVLSLILIRRDPLPIANNSRLRRGYDGRELNSCFPIHHEAGVLGDPIKILAKFLPELIQCEAREVAVHEHEVGFSQDVSRGSRTPATLQPIDDLVAIPIEHHVTEPSKTLGLQSLSLHY